MLKQLWRGHKTTAVMTLVALVLASGWATREVSHAGEKLKLVGSKTVNEADIKITEFTFENRPRGKIGSNNR